MTRPKLVDLFCCGGGAAMGYHRAGFDVVGVDWVDQPDYPFTFVRADAMSFDLSGFDAVHASPPCERFSTMNGPNRRHARLFDWNTDLLTPTLERFASLSVPWVVENVVGARSAMPADAVTLCGSAFGLDVRRHRLFASNVPIGGVACRHDRQTGRFLPTGRNIAAARAGTGSHSRVVGNYGSLNYPGELEIRRRAMGIDWLPVDRLAKAIPPAYTEHLGRQLLASIRAMA